MHHDRPQSLCYVRAVSSKRRSDCLSIAGSVCQGLGHLRPAEKAFCPNLHDIRRSDGTRKLKSSRYVWQHRCHCQVCFGRARSGRELGFIPPNSAIDSVLRGRPTGQALEDEWSVDKIKNNKNTDKLLQKRKHGRSIHAEATSKTHPLASFTHIKI